MASLRGRDKFGLPNWVPWAGLLSSILGFVVGSVGGIGREPVLLAVGVGALALAIVLMLWAHWRYHKTTGRWWFARRSKWFLFRRPQDD